MRRNPSLVSALWSFLGVAIGGKTINPGISTRARLLRQAPRDLGLGLVAGTADNASPLLRPARVADR